MSDQAKIFTYLLDYFSGYDFDTRWLEQTGLLNKKRYNSFLRAFCSEYNIPPSAVPFSFSPMQMGKFAKVRPEFKQVISFLSQVMLPLQIKRLELGYRMDAEEEPADFFKNIQKKSNTQKFEQNKELRWSTYLSVISETINALRDAKNFQSKDEKQRNTDILKARKKAEFLDSNLKKLLKGTGEYFFAKELIWTVQDDENGELTMAFATLSNLFNSPDQMMTKDDIFNKEKDLLDLTARAVIWYPNNIQEKTALFDRFLDLKNKVDSMKGAEEYLDDRSYAEKLRKKQKEKAIKKAYENKTYTSLTSASFYPVLFFRLGLINMRELMSFIVTLSLYITLSGIDSSTDSDEHFGKDAEEQSAAQERELRINVNDFQIPFYRPGFKKLATDVCKGIATQGLFKDFDFKTCYDILETMAPISFLKLCEWDDYFYKTNSGKEVIRERFKYGKKPLNEWNNVQKTDFLISCICSTVQDLRDEKTPRSLKDAKDTQGNMEYILQGVPEYWFNYYLEQMNHYYARRGNEVELHCAKVLLDDMSEYFNLKDCSVTKADIPARMSELKNLANLAILMNPKWTSDEKDELWHNVYQMNIPDMPRIICRPENPGKDEGKGQNTHE